MTPAEERYVHLVSSSDDLNHAWNILRRVRETRPHVLASSAFHFALVAYARPYTASEGDTKWHRLPIRLVPREHRRLHNRLLRARKKILAHSDLTVKEARVRVAESANGKHVNIIWNVIDGTEEIDNLDTIVELIEGTLRNLYSAIEQAEKDLPANE